MKKSTIIMLMLLFWGVSFNTVLAQDTKEWTFMVYLDADCDLEKYGILDFLEMAQVGSTQDVNIVVQMDRIPGYDSSYGDWTDTRRGLVNAGDTPSASWGESIGEVNVGDPATLTGFIDWATTNYPAKNYLLVLWNHGSGWKSKNRSHLVTKAVCWDETSGNDRLSTLELQQGIDNAQTDLDMITFDVCLAAMVEVAYQLCHTGASVMVGSEELEPGDGWPYDSILKDLVATPTMNASQFGAVIVSRYTEFYNSFGQKRTTMSAIDLTQLDTLAGNISNLATTMIDSYASNKDAVFSAADTVMQQLERTVISNGTSGDWQDKAFGLSIDFSTSGPDPSYTGDVIAFAKDTTWCDFLKEYNDSMKGSWLATVRKSCREFGYGEGAGDAFVDLYGFCQNLKTATIDCVLVYKRKQNRVEQYGKNHVESYFIIEFGRTQQFYNNAKLIKLNKKSKSYTIHDSELGFEELFTSNLIARDSDNSYSEVLFCKKNKETDIGMTQKYDIPLKFTGAGVFCYSLYSFTSNITMVFDKKMTKRCNMNGGGCSLDDAVEVIKTNLASKGYVVK